MNPRISLFVLACLTCLSVSRPTASKAQEAAKTIKLDGKTLYIPEVKLTRKVTPVTKYLYVGSWEATAGSGKSMESLCTIDSKNNAIVLESLAKLLGNSKPRVVTQDNVSTYLDSISWSWRQATQVAFKVISDRRQPALIEISTDFNAAVFQNGKFVGSVSDDNAKASGSRGYFPIMLESEPDNIITIKQFSTYGKPGIQLAVSFDHSHDLTAACQARGGLLDKLLYLPSNSDSSNVPMLAWNRNLRTFSPSLEVRDVTTNEIILQRDAVRQGPLFSDENQKPAFLCRIAAWLVC